MQLTRKLPDGDVWTLRKIGQTASLAFLALANPAGAAMSSRSQWRHELNDAPQHRSKQLVSEDFFPADGVQTHPASSSLEALWLPAHPSLPPPAPPPPLPPRSSSLLSKPAPVLQCIEGMSPQPCPAPIVPEPALRSYLAMCVIVRDEPVDLPEWINHYRGLGAGAFYIFDHNSTVPIRSSFDENFFTKDLSYQYFNNFTGEEAPQTTVYNTCIREYGDHHQFIGFLDSDEFLIPRRGPKQLTEFLLEYEDAGSLAINWRQFGSSGHIKRPAGRVVDNYVNCYAADDVNCKHVKIFGNTRYIDRMNGPHSALYTHNRFAVSENKARVDGPFTETISMQKYVLHHYVTRSLEDFEAKIARGTAFGTVSKDIGFFYGVNKQATSLCLAARTKPADDA